MNRNRAVNIGLIIMVVFVAAVGASTIPVTNDLPLQNNDGFTVVLDDVGTFPGTSSFVGNDTISITSGTSPPRGRDRSRSSTPTSPAIPNSPTSPSPG
jgi:hypothetical protein